LLDSTAEPQPTSPQGTWSLPSIAAIAFGHGASDFYSGMVPLLIFFLVVRQQGLSPLHQGIAGFAWYLTSSIVQPLFGLYSDKHGRWWFLPSGVLLTIVSVGLIGFTRDYPTLLLLTALGGIGSSVMHPDAGRYTAQVGSRRHASAISLFQAGGQLGYGLGPIAIAALLERFGGRASGLIALPGLAAVVVLYSVMPRVHAIATQGGPPARAEKAQDGGGSLVDVVLLVASTSLRYMTTSAFITYLPNVLTGGGETLGYAGGVVTAFLVIGNVGLLSGGILGDRLGHRVVSIASLALSVPFLLCFFLLPSPWATSCLLLGSVLLAVQNAPGIALTQAQMPRNLGMALGLMNGVAFGVGSGAVALLGKQVGRIGAGPTLAQVSFVPLLAAACFVMVGRVGGMRRRSGGGVGLSGER
jgi:FSR family fosmidomycin resistance protein-like MFS transporter